MIELAAASVAVFAAALLLLAGCVKLASPSTALLEPLSALGMPPERVAVSTALLGLWEIGAALALVLERGVLATASITFLAVLFLAAGALSWARGLDVPCRCLGSGSGRGRLGARQVAAFPFWLAVGALPLVGPFAEAPATERWWTFLALVGVVAAVFIFQLAKLTRSARDLRLAVGPLT